MQKYNKQKRTFEALSELIQETADEIRYLESVSNSLDIALSEADLGQIKEELTASGYVRRKFTKKKVKLTNKPMHYISSDGYDIYVGKNNIQNDELTFSLQMAVTGGFTQKVLPDPTSLSRQMAMNFRIVLFEEAGRLAAYYSKNRGSDKVEIDYIEKKHVKKPNGAKPGFVVYYTNYSLVIDSDISNIKSRAGLIPARPFSYYTYDFHLFYHLLQNIIKQLFFINALFNQLLERFYN